jgi:hypothetical protein
LAWGVKVGRKVVLEFDTTCSYKLPDHHNAFGEAWWNDGNIYDFKCVFSADKDA